MSPVFGAAIHQKKIDKDYLRKKIWKGEKGAKGFESYMKQSEPSSLIISGARQAP